MYSAQLLDHFQNPRHAGHIEDADAAAEMENPACGDILELTATIAHGCFTAVRFRAKGCVPSMACGSALAELVQGMTLEGARRLRREDIIEKIGGLPEASTHASYLAMDALAALLEGLLKVSETSE
jgi:nitrogen fixation NifU-like protein